MPAILYGAPWTLGEDQPSAYAEAGFESIIPNGDDSDPYLYIKNKKLLAGDELLLARDAAPPLKVVVEGIEPFYGIVHVRIPIMCSTGRRWVTFPISKDVYVKRTESQDDQSSSSRDS